MKKIAGEIWILFDSLRHRQTKALSINEMQRILLNIKLKEIPQHWIWTPGWPEWISLESFMQSEQSYFIFTPELKTKMLKVKKSQSGLWEKDNQKNKVAPDTKTIQTLNIGTLSKTQFIGTVSKTQEIKAVFTNVEKPNHEKVDYGYYFNDFRGDELDINKVLRANLSKSNTRLNNEERRSENRHNYKIEVVLISKNGKSFRSYSENISMGGTRLEHKIPKSFLNSQFDVIIVNHLAKRGQPKRVVLQGKIVGDIVDPKRLMFLELSDQHKIKLRDLLSAYIDNMESK